MFGKKSGKMRNTNRLIGKFIMKNIFSSVNYFLIEWSCFLST